MYVFDLADITTTHFTFSFLKNNETNDEADQHASQVGGEQPSSVDVGEAGRGVATHLAQRAVESAAVVAGQ